MMKKILLLASFAMFAMIAGAQKKLDLSKLTLGTPKLELGSKVQKRTALQHGKSMFYYRPEGVFYSGWNKEFNNLNLSYAPANVDIHYIVSPCNNNEIWTYPQLDETGEYVQARTKISDLVLNLPKSIAFTPTLELENDSSDKYIPANTMYVGMPVVSGSAITDTGEEVSTDAFAVNYIPYGEVYDIQSYLSTASSAADNQFISILGASSYHTQGFGELFTSVAPFTVRAFDAIIKAEERIKTDFSEIEVSFLDQTNNVILKSTQDFDIEITEIQNPMEGFGIYHLLFTLKGDPVMVNAGQRLITMLKSETLQFTPYFDAQYNYDSNVSNVVTMYVASLIDGSEILTQYPLSLSKNDGTRIYINNWCMGIDMSYDVDSGITPDVPETWIDVDLPYPGSLGAQVLSKVNVLRDVKMLRVKGEMNDEDWRIIGEMSSLSNLDLSQAIITIIPDSQFSGKNTLEEIILPEGLETISDYSFRGTNLKTIDIPASVTYIGILAFCNIPALTAVNFAEGSQLDYIHYGAFAYCTQLESFIMPNSVRLLGTEDNYTNGNGCTFQGCSSLKNVVFSDALYYLPAYTCSECTSLETVHIPVSVTLIGQYCFYYNNKLASVNIPSTIRSVYNNAFSGCAIDSLVLSEGCRSIGARAFENCKNLAYVELPVTSSSYNETFAGCDAIETLVINSIAPPKIDFEPFDAINKANINLIVPPLGLTAYKLDSYWVDFENIQATADWHGDIYVNEGTFDLHLPDDIPADWKTNVIMWNCIGRFNLYGKSTLQAKKFDMFINYAKDDIFFDQRESNGNLTDYNFCASFINNANMNAENVQLDLRISKGYWTFMSAPFVVGSMQMEQDVSYVVRKYSGEARANGMLDNTWQDVKNWNEVSPYEGFIIHLDNPYADYAYMEFYANNDEFMNNILISDDVQIGLNEYIGEFEHNSSWNFIGNPYPSFYDMRAMDFVAPIIVWNPVYQTYEAYSPLDDNYILRPFEAFFVQKAADVNAITFRKEGRQHDRVVRESVPYRMTSYDNMSDRTVFNLSLTDGEKHVDRTRFVINPRAKKDYEISRDANKFKSENIEVPQLFTVENGVEFSINERPMLDGIIQLGVSFGKNGTYEIALSETHDMDVFLYDNLLGMMVNLCEESYQFEAEQGKDLARFEIRLGNVVTGVDEITETGKDDVIYDLQGRKLDKAAQNGVFIINGKKVIK